MPKHWRIKPGRSLRDNARLVVPAMIDELLSYKARVISHPRLKHDLHQMRLAGKTLRYAMEVFELGFEPEFSNCLEALKQLLSTMGSIHDYDVNIPRLQSFLKEVRYFNRLNRNIQGRISTSALSTLIREQAQRRRELFVQMVSIFEQWERDNFRNALLKSMVSSNSVKN
jgi:CHAD domain-containing protein